MSVYWHRFRSGLPVTFHLRPEHDLCDQPRWTWTRIIGLSIGPWFVGAIRGVERNGGSDAR